ncbi:MAG: hypothetical protein ACLRYR_05710 [Bifidobacterium dentium]
MNAQEKTKVPAASFSRLSATNVLFGLDKAQLIVTVTGVALLVAGGAMGLNGPLMIVGGLAIVYGVVRVHGLSLLSWTWIWMRWRTRLKDGTNRWAYSPPRRGPAVGRTRPVWACRGSGAGHRGP